MVHQAGKWEISPDGYYPYCTVCTYEPIINIATDLKQYKYCPNCGAEMKSFYDEEGDE